MSDYRCYFVDDQDHIRGVVSHLVSPDDAVAAHAARTLLAERCNREERCRYDAVELWDQTRRVARYRRIYHAS
jgi:hypothetical protein